MFLKRLNTFFKLLIVLLCVMAIRAVAMADIVNSLLAVFLILVVLLAMDNINELLSESSSWFARGSIERGGLHAESDLMDRQADIQSNRRSFRIIKGGK